MIDLEFCIKSFFVVIGIAFVLGLFGFTIGYGIKAGLTLMCA